MIFGVCHRENMSTKLKNSFLLLILRQVKFRFLNFKLLTNGRFSKQLTFRWSIEFWMRILKNDADTELRKERIIFHFQMEDCWVQSISDTATVNEGDYGQMIQFSSVITRSKHSKRWKKFKTKTWNNWIFIFFQFFWLFKRFSLFQRKKKCSPKRKFQEEEKKWLQLIQAITIIQTTSQIITTIMITTMKCHLLFIFQTMNISTKNFKTESQQQRCLMMRWIITNINNTNTCTNKKDSNNKNKKKLQQTIILIILVLRQILEDNHQLVLLFRTTWAPRQDEVQIHFFNKEHTLRRRQHRIPSIIREPEQRRTATSEKILEWWHRLLTCQTFQTFRWMIHFTRARSRCWSERAEKSHNLRLNFQRRTWSTSCRRQRMSDESSPRFSLIQETPRRFLRANGEEWSKDIWLNERNYLRKSTIIYNKKKQRYRKKLKDWEWIVKIFFCFCWMYLNFSIFLRNVSLFFSFLSRKKQEFILGNFFLWFFKTKK